MIPPARVPIVFIGYSHDSPDHAAACRGPENEKAERHKNESHSAVF